VCYVIRPNTNRIRIVDASSNRLPNALVSLQSGEKFQDRAFCIHVKRMILTNITNIIWQWLMADSWQWANEMVKKMS